MTTDTFLLRISPSICAPLLLLLPWNNTISPITVFSLPLFHLSPPTPLPSSHSSGGGMVGNNDVDSHPSDCQFPNIRKTYWRSATWTSLSAPPTPSLLPSPPDVCGGESSDSGSDACSASCSQGTDRHARPRVFIPPLNCFSLPRTGLDEWPSHGSDQTGDGNVPVTPGRRRTKNGPDIRLDLASIQCSAIEPTEIQLKREKFAHFDRQCSRVANYHIYLGSDAVARDREILRMNRITHVLNCVGFVCPEYFKDELVYKTLWLQDSPGEDITSLLYDVFDYFEDVREQDGRVFVHCCQGVSRSTTLVIAYLMWRQRSSFEDAFQDVKTARGVTNPNMGFACQLLQWQKRVHATPVSSNSMLRMYKLVPHSSYDPLHLVPKAVSNLGAGSLDSRGAFVIQSSQLIIVWVGHYCDCKMTQAAVAAADQILRYERIHVPVKIIGEGREDAEFWKLLKEEDGRLRNGCMKDESDGFGECVSDYSEKSTEIIAQIGTRKVSSNDAEYELYRLTRIGGVIPPVSFSSSPTLLPLREDGWTAVRCKFLSGEILGAAKVASLNGIPVANILSPDTSMGSSSLHLSPFSSTSASSTHSSCDSSNESPTFCGGNLAHCSDSLTSNSVCSAHGPNSSFNSLPETIPLNPFAENTNKRSVSSLAHRRGSVPPVLHLPGLEDDPPPAPRGMSRRLRLPPMITEGQQRAPKLSNHRIGTAGELLVSQQNQMDSQQQPSSSSYSTPVSLVNDSCQSDSDVVCSYAAGSQYLQNDTPNNGRASLHVWPGFEQINMYDVDDLDTGAVLVLDATKCHFKVFVWVGKLQPYQNENPNNEFEESWYKIGQDFLQSMGLSSDVIIRVVREGCEPEEFWEAFN